MKEYQSVVTRDGKVALNDRWSGVIVTNDFMTWKELLQWETALKEAQKISDEGGSVIQFYDVLLPIALKIVKEWKIEGLPAQINSADELPASTEFVAFLIDSISKLFTETNATDPN